MRIAFYNIENLFFRYRSLKSSISDRCQQKEFSEFDELLNLKSKSHRELTRIQQLTRILGFEQEDPARTAKLNHCGCSMQLYNGHQKLDNSYFQNKKKGWIDIVNYPLRSSSISNKAMTVAEANADLLFLLQVENRQSIERFNNEVLINYPFVNYSNIDVFGGNDYRDINHAILLRKNAILEKSQSYKNQKCNGGENLFHRDFSVYEVIISGAKRLWIFLIELASTGDNKHISDELRLKQCKFIANVYNDLRNQGITDIIIMGSFYALPYCYSLAPLFNTGLKEISRHHRFFFDKDHGEGGSYHSLGAYKKGLNLKQYDYLFLTSELYSKVKSCGLIRKGVWAGRSRMWPVYERLSDEYDQASSHPILWLDLDI